MKRQYTDISHFRAPYKNWPYLGIGEDTAANAAPWYKNPIYIGGVLAVAAGAYFFMAKPTRSAAVANKRRRNARAKANAHKCKHCGGRLGAQDPGRVCNICKHMRK